MNKCNAKASHQTGQIPMLISVYTGRIYHIVVLITVPGKIWFDKNMFDKSA